VGSINCFFVVTIDGGSAWAGGWAERGNRGEKAPKLPEMDKNGVTSSGF
jgi:hypothetical protein